MLPLRITLFAVWVLLLAIGGATTVRAQEGTLRTVDDDPGGRTLELTIDWPASLSQVVDSLEGRVLDEAAAGLLSGGWWSWSEQVELPSLASPSVRLVSADYDEVRIAEPGSVSEELGQLLEMLGTPVVYDAGVGLERRRPVASIAFRPIHFDRESGVLKRYRRITAAVRYSEPSGGTLGRASLVTRNPHLSVSRSALADGLVFKIPIRDEGVYRISHTMLQQMLSGTGMEAADVRPSEIKLLGNGGAPLPAIAGDPRPADLIENPVVVDGGADGSFDAGDGILFFARGASGWEYNPDDGWQHYLNPFSTVNYYFLKIGGEEGRRVQVQSFDSVTNSEIVSTVEGRHFVQPDEMMWAKDGGSGLTWLSRRIQSTGEFKILDQFEAPGLVPGTVRYEARVAIQSNPRTAVRFYHGNEMVGRILASRSIGSGSYTPVAALSDGMFEHVVSDDRLNLAMRLESAQNSPSAALRWLRVFYAKRLVARSGFLSFSTPAGAAGSFEFRLSGFSEAPVVWHVRDGAAVRALEVQPFDGGYRVRTSVTDPAFPHELVAFTPSAITSLESALDSWDLSFVRVPPQNLHGSGGYPSFVIITPAEFQSSAERLAEHRREQGLDVRVVDIQQIYNEFSGGLPDMRAVRDYLKFLYDRGPVSEPALRYALLFGDGHYNFRGLSDGGETPQLDNHIFPYQTEETLDPIRSYTSDDYFGLLDDIEGAWPYATESTAAPSGYPVERVDIGIGRLTVQTSQEAEVVVSKLIDYDDVRSRGAWRGMYTMLADDGPTGLSGTTNDADLHTQNADAVATLIEASFPKVNLRKIYAQSYQREFLGAWRIPSARRDVLSALNDGTLVFNYSGHGNTEALMQEEVFTRSDVARLTNQDRLSIFVTATCDFGRWDLQDRQSTAEELLLHAGGGSVALFTTVRVVYTSPNINSLNVGLNRELNRTMFSADDDGRARRLGDILRITKNTAVGLQGNNRKFNLLGDPTTRIGIPAAEVAIESVNEVDIRQESAALRALERIVVRGSVRNLQGDLDPGFNGTVDLTVFDASRRVPVVDQRWMPNEYYTVREDLIWRGRANVLDGQFEATFVVPKDISYRNESGRISAYAAHPNGQALGFTENVVVGGTAQGFGDDDEGPEIRLFLNDTTFVSGEMTGPNPRLIVQLFDESGINTVGAGVGHEILLTFNDNDQDFVDLNRFYESEADSYQRGRIEYRIEHDLNSGMNSLSVRAWDVANNSSTERLDFFVGESETLTLRDVFNYPNPTSGRTRFVFQHNQPSGTPARVQVRIYSLSGRPIRTIRTEEALPSGIFTSGTIQIPWDGRDDDLGLLASGVYFYRLRVEIEGADGDRQVSEHIDRIAIIR